MDLKYIDIHGHVNFPEFDEDREAAILRAQNAGIGMITVGTDLESSKKAIELAEVHEHVWASIGIHPTDSGAAVDFGAFHELARHPKVVALGECGLDYFHSTPEQIPKQREVFLQHIQLANEVKKPLMLHVRNGKSTETAGINAYQEAIAILKEHARVRANFHFFAGTEKDAADIVAMGNTMSFTGVLTFARNYDAIIKNTPLSNIMSETDCPYVAPIPYRGKRNEPAYVIEVVKKIAQIREEEERSAAEQLLKNALEFFAL